LRPNQKPSLWVISAQELDRAEPIRLILPEWLQIILAVLSQDRQTSEIRVTLDEVFLGTQARGIEILALDQALSSLSRMDARKGGRVVELRYFGGLSVAETAEVMKISPETVKRDWKMAKAWLFGELSGEKDRAGS
jgi:DNA-directed RNA polymerase specialized sigma24 family protein